MALIRLNVIRVEQSGCTLHGTFSNPLTGEVWTSERVFPLSIEDMFEAVERWATGALIQDAFQRLSAEDREWFLTGNRFND